MGPVHSLAVCLTIFDGLGFIGFRDSGLGLRVWDVGVEVKGLGLGFQGP